MFSVKRIRYKGTISRLFDYGELAEFAFKLAVYSAIALYIALITGLLVPGSTALSALGVLTLRVAFTILLLIISIYLVREFRVTRIRTERKRIISQRDVRKALYSLMALLIATAAFYALLLYY